MKIGIIGGGQLGQMLAMAAIPLGQQVICLEKTSDCPAGLVTDIFEATYDDVSKIKELSSKIDVITYEFENISVETLKAIESHLPIYPPIKALEVSQERVIEKTFFNRCKVPTVAFEAVNSEVDLLTAVKKIGLPGILKTCRLGYDGKGQFHLKEASDIPKSWKELGNQPLIYEERIEFDKEVSMIGVRGRGGQIAFYPLIENHHKNGILNISKAPYENEALTSLAQCYTQIILETLNYVGVLTVEFFVKADQLYANEMAPRVHNSGHWTIEGAECSQFENHIRAICNLPLGSTRAIGHATMTNIIGELPDIKHVLATPGAHLHLYGKTPRKERKLGHITTISIAA